MSLLNEEASILRRLPGWSLIPLLLAIVNCVYVVHDFKH
jgi:hypothetical protein